MKRAWCTAVHVHQAGACVGREGHGGGGGGGEWGVSYLYLCRQGFVGSLLPAFPPNEILLHHTLGLKGARGGRGARAGTGARGRGRGKGRLGAAPGRGAKV